MRRIDPLFACPGPTVAIPSGIGVKDVEVVAPIALLRVVAFVTVHVAAVFGAVAPRLTFPRIRFRTGAKLRAIALNIQQ